LIEAQPQSVTHPEPEVLFSI